MDSTENSKAGSGERRRKRKKRSSSSRSASAQKNNSKLYTKFMGIILVVFGLIMCFYSFGLFDSTTAFKLPDFSDIITFWPIFIVLLGFVIVIKDYVTNASTASWKDKR